MSGDVREVILARLAEEPAECGGAVEYQQCWDLSERHERMVAGIRAVVDLHDERHGYDCGVCGVLDGPCSTLTAIAAIWAPASEERGEVQP